MKNEILNKSHSKLDLEFLLIHNNEMLNQVQHDDRGHSGFTLVELLVVVLIIGILAAVAMPQYNKAVMRSRYGALKTLVRAIANANEVYYMENDKYAFSFDELAVQLPAPSATNADNAERTYEQYNYTWGYCRLTNSGTSHLVKCQNDAIKMAYQLNLNHSPAKPGQAKCVADVEDLKSLQAQICGQETGHEVENEYTHIVSLY